MLGAMRPSPTICALHALLLAGALPPAALAEVRDSIDYSYYEVQVFDGPSLGTQVRAASPIREGGQVSFGNTRWNVRWDLRWNSEASGRCRLTSVIVTLRSRMLLPQLRGASARQTAAFERFMAALRLHENGHYAHGQRAAREIERNLLALPPAASCATLEAQANESGRRSIARHADLDIQYDRETSHGRTQGAYLP